MNSFAAHRASLVLGVAILLTGFACPTEAKRIVVLGFAGPNGASAAAELRRALDRSFQVVSDGRLRQAARRAGSSIRTRQGLARATTALKVSAIIRGSVARLADRWILRANVVSAASGRTVGGITVPLRGTRLEPRTARRAALLLARRIRLAQTASSAQSTSTKRPIAVESVEDEPVRKKPPPLPPPVEDPPEKPVPEDTTDDGAKGPQKGPQDDLGFSTPKAAPERSKTESAWTAPVPPKQDDTRPPWETIFEVQAGIMIFARKFDFNDPVDPAVPGFYRSGVIAALVLQGDVYPLAAFMRGPLANIGIRASYYRALGLKSRLSETQLADTVLQGFDVGLGYRWNLFSKRSSLTLYPLLTFGKHGFFILDSGAQVDLPNISYTYLSAGARAEIPFYASERLIIGGSLGGDYRYVFSAGDIERTDSHGYGRSQTGAVELGGEVFGRYHGFTARLRGFYQRYFFDFDSICYYQKQTGCRAAGGALDEYFGAAIFLGYAY
jgi:hypothetical protein